MTQHHGLVSVAAWLSSTGISHHSLLPHIPLIRLSTVNSSPRPGTAPQSPNSSSQPLHPLRDLSPSRGMYGCGKNCLILILFRLSQISCFTLSLKCFSSDSDSCPSMGIGPLLQFPRPPREVQSYQHSCFSPCFRRPTEFCVGLYILFCWSGPPVCSQLVFCIHFCV